MHNSALFTSGEWYGFYRDLNEATKHVMEMQLIFHAGFMEAHGWDPKGEFIFRGSYQEEKRSCSWKKHYPGSHTDEYAGKISCKGISGSWLRGKLVGVFCIWPIGEPADASSINLFERPSVGTCWFCRKSGKADLFS